jgi:Helix-turn-helix domain
MATKSPTLGNISAKANDKGSDGRIEQKILKNLAPLVQQLIEDEIHLLNAKSGRELSGTFEDLGALLRKERKDQRLTLDGLCDLCGVSKPTLQRIESSKEMSSLVSSLQNIALIARALGVSLSIR